MNLKDKVVFISGAATRVGKHIATEFSKKGANIAFTYLSSDEPWQDTLEEIESTGSKAMAIQMDVRKPNEPSECIEKTVKSFGKLDILVNNASIWLENSFLDISLEDWNLSLAVNLTGPFLCSQAAAKIMLHQNSGVIINITDLSAFQAWQRAAHHSAGKAGLVALTRSMATELAPYIRVNAIAPGTVLLPPNANENKKKWAIENSLLKRIGTPEDVARTAIFLSETDFITGAVFFIDGGRALV